MSVVTVTGEPTGRPAGRRAATGADGSPGKLQRIGATAALTGVSERTLRYYEEIGLLSPAAHSTGGCREYGEPEVARVRRIRELQELMGLNLDEIRALLAREDRAEDLRRAWNASDDPAVRRPIIDEAIRSTCELRERLHGKLSRLEDFLGELDERLAHLSRLRDELG